MSLFFIFYRKIIALFFDIYIVKLYLCRAMLKKCFYTLTICLLLAFAMVPSWASAQSATVVSVSGLVTSAEDKQPLIGVTVVTAVAATLLGICPADGGHGPVDVLNRAHAVVAEGQGGIHSAHNGLTEIDVGDLAGVDADIAVAQLIGVQLLDAVSGHGVELVDVVLGVLGGDVVNRALLERRNGVGYGSEKGSR